ncbi:MAG: hypothetical protein QF449_17115, partial [Alphaproteobacteria bacterium]|nr:hypothetical protein [Alphaproteobacteria bacterium]
MPSNSEAVLKRLANEALRVRRNVWRALHAASAGHVGGSTSAADLLAALYFHYLNRHFPDNLQFGADCRSSLPPMERIL